MQNKQHEIRERQPLLDDKGQLSEAGYAKELLLDYDRAAVKGGRMRIKEWDYYLIANDDFAVALTIADNSYMGLDSISLLDFNCPWEITKSEMQAFTFGRKGLPSSSVSGDVSSRKAGGKNPYSLSFANDGKVRRLVFEMKGFKDGKPIKGDITLANPTQDSMVISTPFAEKKTAFYYNQKINCLPADGTVEFDGKTYRFEPATSFAVLDWGRGVWTYDNTWYWSSASGTLPDGTPFGFNLGYGFGDTSAATENMVFCGGKAHKLGQVTFNIPTTLDSRGRQTEDYMSPWTFTDGDGRLELAFVPIIDRAACINAGIICSDQHQVFGKFTGFAVLDDGSRVEIRDFLGFAEKVHNKW